MSMIGGSVLYVLRVGHGASVLCIVYGFLPGSTATHLNTFTVPLPTAQLFTIFSTVAAADILDSSKDGNSLRSAGADNVSSSLGNSEKVSVDITSEEEDTVCRALPQASLCPTMASLAQHSPEQHWSQSNPWVLPLVLLLQSQHVELCVT
ncbi:unnamed protein product [Arctogadus glacialis]